MFRNREDAARQLASMLHGRSWKNLVVLAIPRGGVVVGAVLARELGGELDVVLARKLRAPGQPELAVGALGEDGQVYLDPHLAMLVEAAPEYLARERRCQMGEMARRRRLLRGGRPPLALRGRSVVVTDDGIATGSTMIAALRVARAQQPHELVVAVPVASPDRVRAVAARCDELVCLMAPDDFAAVGQFYEDFAQVEDATVVKLLADLRPAACAPAGSRAAGPGRQES